MTQIIEASISRIAKKYKDSLNESMQTDAAVSTRANLIGITRTPTNIIFPEVTLLRPTNSIINTMLAVTYLDNNLNDIRLSPSDLSGAAGILDKDDIKTGGFDKGLVKGDYFSEDGVIYKVLVDDPTIQGTVKTIQSAIFSNTIRHYSDNSKDTKFETFKGSEARFIISRWDQKVGSRKAFASITKEIYNDISAQGVDADGALEDLLISASSEGINKDVIQKLITISTKYLDNSMSGESIVDMSKIESITEAGRQLHYYATELAAQVEMNTHYNATYIIGSSRAVSLLTASGWLQQYEGDDNSACVGTIAGGKLKVFKDTQSKYDYMVAGFVHEDDGSIEGVGSLVVTPYLEQFGSISDLTVVQEPNSFNFLIQMILRYGIGTNPYTVKDNIEYDTDDEGNKLNSVKGYYKEADDWEALAGKSLSACSVGLILPRSVK